jgi:hypothetical protein
MSSTSAPGRRIARSRPNRVTVFFVGFGAFDVLIWTAAALVR